MSQFAIERFFNVGNFDRLGLEKRRSGLGCPEKDPKSVSIGVQPGSADLINITLLLTAVGIDPAQVRLVTFKGGGPARNAVLGGTVDVGLVGAEGFLPLRSRVVPLMLFNDERLADWADVQTITEYAKAKNLTVEWVPGSQRGWVLPAGVGKQNPAIRAKWVDAIEKAMNDPQWIALAKEQQLPNFGMALKSHNSLFSTARKRSLSTLIY